MAHHAALPGILEHGLLSTEALLDLFEVHGDEREAIIATTRKNSVGITHPKYGTAVIRDQKPIVSDKRLQSALGDSATSEQFLRLLNSKVFFWVDPARLHGLRDARAYRGDPQLILTLDTRKVVQAALNHTWLCPMNSGCCRPMAFPRTLSIFQKLTDFDFLSSKKKRGWRNAVVECAVHDRLRNIGDYLIKTENVG
jgi:hypothetical protein